MQQDDRPFPRLGAAVSRAFAGAGMKPYQVAMRAKKDPSQVYKLVGGKLDAGERFLAAVAAGAKLSPDIVKDWLREKELDKQPTTAGAPEVAPPARPADFRAGEDGGSPGDPAGRASRPAPHVAGAAGAGGDRVTQADLSRLVARLESVLSEALGRPVNLSCRPVDDVLRPAWRDLPSPVGPRAWNPAVRGAAEGAWPFGSQRPSRLASLSRPAIRETVGPSSPSRPGASLTRRSGSRA